MGSGRPQRWDHEAMNTSRCSPRRLVTLLALDQPLPEQTGSHPRSHHSSGRPREQLSLEREIERVRDPAETQWELASARECLDRGLERARTVEYRQHVDGVHLAFAWLDDRQGNFETGESHADAVLQHDESSEKHNVAGACAARGHLLLAQGNIEGALAANERGHERATATESPRSCVRNRCGLADAHRRAGRRETAREQAEAALRTAGEQSNPLPSVEAALSLGLVQRAADQGRAEETLRSALTDAREIGAAVHECEARYELGRRYRQLGATADARDALGAVSPSLKRPTRRCTSAVPGVPWNRSRMIPDGQSTARKVSYESESHLTGTTRPRDGCSRRNWPSHSGSPRRTGTATVPSVVHHLQPVTLTGGSPKS